MRRLALVVLAVLVSAASIGGVAFAQAGGSDPEGDTPGRPDVFFLYAQAGPDVVIPAIGGPPPGDEFEPTVGDVNIFRDDLFALDPATDGPTGDQIGTADIHCTFTRVDFEAFSVDLLCSGVVTLPRGMITLQTLVTFSEESPAEVVVPITGGSGAYADAGGRLVVHELEDDDAIFEFRLVHLALQP